jgi:hypothetical protein
MTERKRDMTILIVALLVWGTLMLAHPTHAVGKAVLWRLSTSDIVHATAIFVKPVLVFGFWKLSAVLGQQRPLVAIGLSFYVLGQIAMLSAGAVSGWITPAVYEPVMVAQHQGGGITADGATAMQLGRFSSLINQGYAHIYTILVSTALLLWSLAWNRGGSAGVGLRGLGLIVGGGILLWEFSGQFDVTPGRMAIVAAGHTLWGLAAAAAIGWGSQTAEISAPAAGAGKETQHA